MQVIPEAQANLYTSWRFVVRCALAKHSNKVKNVAFALRFGDEKPELVDFAFRAGARVNKITVNA